MQTPDAAELKRVEAARYALLRRLALAMRHHMVVHLQPMGLITELIERRLVAPEPDLAKVHEGMGKIHQLARAAVDSCADMVSWLAPPEGRVVALDDGVQEVLSLVRSNFNFRGFPLLDTLGGVRVEVPRASVRHILPAVLLALTDRAPPPADVTIRTESLPDGGAAILVDVAPRAGEPGFPANHPYRLLDWSDIEVLARAEGAAVTRDGGSARIELRG